MTKLTNILIESASFIALIALAALVFFGYVVWRALGSIGEHKYEKGGEI